MFTPIKASLGANMALAFYKPYTLLMIMSIVTAVRRIAEMFKVFVSVMQHILCLFSTAVFFFIFRLFMTLLLLFFAVNSFSL